MKFQRLVNTQFSLMFIDIDVRYKYNFFQFLLKYVSQIKTLQMFFALQLYVELNATIATVKVQTKLAF